MRPPLHVQVFLYLRDRKIVSAEGAYGEREGMTWRHLDTGKTRQISLETFQRRVRESARRLREKSPDI
jgi:hypothetical protein